MLNRRWSAQARVAAVTVQILCAVHLFNEHVAEVRLTAGSSMEPLFNGEGGNLVLTESLTFTLPWLRTLSRGDVVVATHPYTRGHICKRIVGMPGDEVLIDPRSYPREWVKIPQGHVWLVGDNLEASRDSRYYGPIPLALVKGRVIAKIWPDPGLLKTHPPQPVTVETKDGEIHVTAS